jgi:chromosome partitioning protein
LTTIALINQKGGVGKTTVTMNLGAGLAQHGCRVLMIDLDPQANLTYSLGISAHELDASVHDLLKGDVPVSDILIDRADRLQLLPSSLELSGAEMELSSVAGREFLLREALESFSEPDYILIDCPPSLGLLTINALTSAQKIYVPVQTEFLALQGMSTLIQTIEVVQRRLNRDLRLSGIIATRYDGRKNLNREVVERIGEHFGDKVFKTLIRENVSLAESPSYGQTIFEYKPGSRGAADFLMLCKEVRGRRADRK